MAKAQASELTYPELAKQIKSGEIAPVYLLYGEEDYYIDSLTEMLKDLISEEDREFNLHELYASEVEYGKVMDICYQYPMMAERQVVILKEAQTVKAATLNNLSKYALNPSPTTVLVICVRVDRSKTTAEKERAVGKELLAAVKKQGVVFKSKAPYDNQIRPIIADFIREKGLTADSKSFEMLADYVGTDLSHLYNEIGKLALILGKGACVTPDHIEQYIGMSKSFNNFELVKALATKDSQKAFRIINYFTANPKANPIPQTASAIFNFFANVLMAFYCTDKSSRGLAQEIGVKYPQSIDVEEAMRRYNAWQVIEIISAVRRFDAMSKGIGSRQSGAQLLRDLIYLILTTPGRRTV